MGKRFVTFLVVPEGGGRSLRLRVSLGFLRAAALLALLPCVTFLGLSQLDRALESGRVESEALRAAVESAERRSMLARSRIFQLGRRIELLTTSLEEFQALAEVDFGPEVMAAGGGETYPGLEDPDFFHGSVDDMAAIAAEKADFWTDLLRDRIEDQVVLLASTPSILPVRGLITHGYAWRRDPFTGRRSFHRGLDISARRGTPVKASADGVITFAGWNGTYGRTIDVNHGYGVTTRYGHLHKVLVSNGDWVRKGQAIGEVGSSGRATGPHLHYELLENGRPVNPMPRYVLDEPDVATR